MTWKTRPHTAYRKHLPRTSVMLTVALVACLAATVQAENRWHDRMQGVSFVPPAGLIERAWPDPATRISFMDQNGDAISFAIRRRRDVETGTDQAPIIVSPMEQKATDRFHFEIHADAEELTLDRVEEIAKDTMELRDVNCVMLDRTDLTPRDVPASALYFKVGEPLFALTEAEKQTPAWMIGFAFAPMRDDTFAVFQLQAAMEGFPAMRKRFETMINSLQVEDPEHLAQRRRDMIQRGDLWLEMLDAEQVRHRLHAVQWFRLQRGEEEIGWMRVQEREAEEMGMSGFGVRTDTHMTSNDRSYDGTEQCFVTWDGEHEIWSRRMTVRPAPVGAVADAEVTLTTMNETGTRSGDVIRVSRKGPEGIHQFSWRRPSAAYLSQGTMRVMGRLLPHKRPSAMAFYAYHPNAVSILLRCTHVEPDDRGAYAVTMRPGPDHPDDVTHFDAEGTFLRRAMHGGITLVATDEEELRTLWNLPSR